MTSPLCTVVIPCHNGEEFLEAAFRSVMDQSFQAFHLVMVDDASQDGTMALAKSLGQGKANVTVVELPENQGRCFARNAGTRINGSPFVAFLDQDDTYHRDFLKVAVQTLQSNSEIDAVRVSPKISIELHPLFQKAISDSLANTMVFRRRAFEFVGGWPDSPVFRELKMGGEDIAIRRVFLMIFREAILDARLYNYNHRPGNALDLFLKRSKIVGDQIHLPPGDPNDKRHHEEIQRLKWEFAAKLRQLIYQQS